MSAKTDVKDHLAVSTEKDKTS